MRTLHIVLASAVMATCSLAPAIPVRAEHCSGVLLDGIATRVRAIEAEQPATSDDFVRRSKELATLLADPSSPLWQSANDTCPGDAVATQLRTVARQRLLVLWGKMIALAAVDGPIFPAPYRRECSRFDGSSLQLDFIRAWLERLDDGGAGFSRGAIWQTLEEDPLYGHVRQLAQERARRLKITFLPTQDSDEDAWLQANEVARTRFAAALPRGARCGTLSGLWGLEHGGAARVGTL
jgi:hypothetical protein